ncbi:MAG TPA: glucokinase [Burkholderiales bacterium]|nr:glucokinase [Burkholderiales bacterium]
MSATARRRYLLAADFGGTKAALALASAGGNRQEIVAERVYACHEFDGVQPILADFLEQKPVAGHRSAIAAACFSVAGPVAGNSTTLTNLGWKISGNTIAADLRLPEVRLVNDFAAAGMGITRLTASELDTLQAGSPVARAARLVIGAGTGLGVGVLTWQEEGYAVHASEAGHADFAPVDELQDKLLAHLRRTYGRVSYERVISGPGLMRIFSFLQETGAGVPSKQLRDADKTRKDTAELIAEFGLAKLDPLAVRALDLFVAAYGAFAGNLALTMLAHGGVYIAGGIAPKIAPKLREGAFMRAFTSKGRFSDLLSAIPVHVVMNPLVGLYGALMEAARLGGGKSA